jgi:hypothetical protein
MKPHRTASAGRDLVVQLAVARCLPIAKLFDRVEQTTGIIPFARLVEQVTTVEPGFH